MKLTTKIDFLSFCRKRTFLGVDIGTSSIKLVQLTLDRAGYKLDTYGEVHLFSKDSRDKFEEKSLKILDDKVASLLTKVLKESKVKAKKVAMSVPVFSSFSTVIEMPDLPRSELNKAIEFQARQHIPVPIDQVSLSSVVIKREQGKNGKSKGKLQVLLVAVPNEVKGKYDNIAKLSNLDLVALEMETFPMARAIMKESKDSVLIIDIGARSTNYCIADEGVVKLSHNYEVSGVSLTKAFSRYLGEDFKKSENLKKTVGLKFTPGQTEAASEVMHVANSIVVEAERILSVYFNKTSKRIDYVVLSGGSSSMPGLVDYLSEKLEKKVSIAHPFSGINHPKELEKVLKKIGPSFSIAIGLAMRR